METIDINYSYARYKNGKPIPIEKYHCKALTTCLNGCKIIGHDCSECPYALMKHENIINNVLANIKGTIQEINVVEGEISCGYLENKKLLDTDLFLTKFMNDFPKYVVSDNQINIDKPNGKIISEGSFDTSTGLQIKDDKTISITTCGNGTIWVSVDQLKRLYSSDDKTLRFTTVYKSASVVTEISFKQVIEIQLYNKFEMVHVFQIIVDDYNQIRNLLSFREIVKTPELLSYVEKHFQKELNDDDLTLTVLFPDLHSDRCSVNELFFIYE